MWSVFAALAATLSAAPSEGGEIENVRSLDLELRGTVAQRCAMGSVADMDFGNLARQQASATAHVTLDCNIPFDMTIEAVNGGLAHERLPRGEGPYAGTLPYEIGISMPVRKPGQSLVRRTIASRDLVGGHTVSSDGGIAVDGMDVTVSLGQPAGEAGLLGGNYSETIRITIAPS